MGGLCGHQWGAMGHLGPRCLRGGDGDGCSTRLRHPSVCLFSLCSCRGWILVPRSGLVRGSASSSGAGRWLLRSPSQSLNGLPEAGTDRGTGAHVPRSRGHCTAQAWREGLDVAQISWEVAAAGSSAQGGGRRVEGDPGTPLRGPALPAPSSRLRRGLGGAGHPPGAVEGEAEPSGCQQQGQGGQQPPPRVGPPPRCQLHLQGERGVE